MLFSGKKYYTSTQTFEMCSSFFASEPQFRNLI
uniref:Uncharacterized protein n=1 Tax=Anguilla anguilla TaxID=7936 RepID=A0A0E9SQP6_ANGAN